MSYNLGHVVGQNGKGIQSIVKTSTEGLTDIYTITYTNGDTQTYTVTNGKDATADIVTEWEQTLSDEKIPSEKLAKNTIDTKLDKVHTNYKGKNVVTNASTGAIEFEDKQSIPTKTSDLTNDGSSSSDSLVYVETSATSGLIKNDGSIMTSGTGSSNWAVGNHSHSGMLTTSDIANNLTTTTGGKVLDARQGKALADLIGDAISYINQ